MNVYVCIYIYICGACASIGKNSWLCPPPSQYMCGYIVAAIAVAPAPAAAASQ